MKINGYCLVSGKLQINTVLSNRNKAKPSTTSDTWFDIVDAEPDGLREFLTTMDIHPLQMERCLDTVIDPGVIAFENSLLIEYPASLDKKTTVQSYLAILLKSSVLITIRHGSMPALDELLDTLTSADAQPLYHLTQIIYLILDHFADLNVDAQTEIRDQILELSRTMVEKPHSINAKSITQLRWQVGNLISLVENQLYCVSGLAALDIDALKEPHRKAYIEDIVSEVEIAQRGVYRLESRVDDLYRDYQMIGNDRMEKRLRLLTIVSAITLPLGLVAGLLGMNVGGVPGTNLSSGFLIVVLVMVVIALGLFWYFKRTGWFD